MTIKPVPVPSEGSPLGKGQRPKRSIFQKRWRIVFDPDANDGCPYIVQDWDWWFPIWWWRASYSQREAAQVILEAEIRRIARRKVAKRAGKIVVWRQDDQ